MKIYLVQHGLALAEEEDPTRPLSSLGREEVAGVARSLAGRVSISAIHHSGKPRAQQTAAILAETLGVSEVVAVAGLGPGDDVGAYARNLAPDGTMVVGHLPHLAKLAALLVTGDESRPVVRFQNAAVTCLERATDAYHVLWSIPPKL